jgi:hypothetical protein
MQPIIAFRRAALMFALALLVSTAAVGFAQTNRSASATGVPHAAPAAEAGPGGFVGDDGPLAGHAPDLAFAAGKPWLIRLASDNAIRVASFEGGGWQHLPDALPGGSAQAHAALAFVDTTPWVARAAGSSAQQQVGAARFVSGAWQQAGGALNRNANSVVHGVDIAAGSTDGGAPAPWLAWSESGQPGWRVFVSRIAGDAAQPVGGALNLAGDALFPEIGFAGATPWVAWSELSGGVAAARAVADGAAPGGYRWQPVGRQSGCGGDLAACLLNIDPARAASDIHLVDGALPGESGTSLWVAFSEKDAAGVSQVYVRRLDGDRFRQVGGSLNIDPTQNASRPEIVFVGNVPHVAWVESRQGRAQVFVRHLGDARPGQERWDLNVEAGTTSEALSVSPQAVAANFLALASSGTTPYVAWDDGSAEVRVAHREPAGGAWGRNYPPFIRIISGTVRLAASLSATLDTPGAEPEPTIITTSCDHVSGWDSIDEIQMRLADAQGSVFLGRYVAAENKVYLEDADRPGEWLGGLTPGAAGSIETRFVSLDVGQLRITSHGAGSAALDIDWPIAFKQPAYGRVYTQAINIVYREGTAQRATSQTGFFGVGQAQVGDRQYLPLVVR